jgi:asparagine synthase (glutamine-hydrolysing)
MMFQRAKEYLKQIPGLQKLAFSGLNPKVYELITAIRAKKLTYLSDKKLVSIAKTCQGIEEAKLPGIFVEAGCTLGASSI